jgi:tripartite-type tricarboxylate transporter receptor subunit TctC
MNSLLKATIGVAMAACIAAASLRGIAQTQQTFPTKSIRLMVPASAGSQTDILGRMLSAKMSETWGQPIIVDSRPGALGALAANIVAKAPPDGHTLLLSTNHAVSAALQPDLPYDPLKDFAGVAQIGYGTSILVVAHALGVKSLNDLVALAKAQPGKIIFGSSAVGSGVHLTGASFNRAAGIKVVSVAFKGSPEATMEVLGGRVHYTLAPLAVVLPYIRDGRLLALAASKHIPVLPDVPALGDTFPEFKRISNSYGLLAPAATPRPILQQISKEVARIVDLPDIKERLHPTGFVIAPSTPDEFDTILREQIDSLSKLVRDLGLRAK